MVFYLQFLNPYETATSPNTKLSVLPYDAVIGDIKITTGTGTLGADPPVPDTALFEWGDDGLADSYCTAEHSPGDCTKDSTNDWTTTTTG